MVEQLQNLRGKFQEIFTQMFQQQKENSEIAEENLALEEQIQSLASQHQEGTPEAEKKEEDDDGSQEEEEQEIEDTSEAMLEFIVGKDKEIEELTHSLYEIYEVMKQETEEIENFRQLLDSKARDIEQIDMALPEYEGVLEAYFKRIGEINQAVSSIEEEITVASEKLSLKEEETTENFTQNFRYEEHCREQIEAYRAKMAEMSKVEPRFRESEKEVTKKCEEYNKKCGRLENLAQRRQMLEGKLLNLKKSREDFNQLLHENNIIKFQMSEMNKRAYSASEINSNFSKNKMSFSEKERKASQKSSSRKNHQKSGGNTGMRRSKVEKEEGESQRSQRSERSQRRKGEKGKIREETLNREIVEVPQREIDEALRRLLERIRVSQKLTEDFIAQRKEIMIE